MSKSADSARSRGRDADAPSEIPSRGWWDVLMRVKDEINKDNVSLVAAGVAFYGLLAIFPALAAVVAIYGLMVSPTQVEQQVAALAEILPQQAASILDSQLSKLSQGQGGALGFAALFGLLLSLYSATKGTGALITAMNIAYDEQEERGFVKLLLVSFGFTLLGIVFIIVSAVCVAAIPALLGNLGLPNAVQTALSLGRWPILLVLVMLLLALLYRYGPCRRDAKWRWNTPGAMLATVLWLIGSIGFSIYVRNFGSYNETYGSLGAVVVLLMWLWLTAFIIILGAELNAEAEHQTKRDTTTGGRQPLGKRGAYVADTVGETR